LRLQLSFSATKLITANIAQNKELVTTAYLKPSRNIDN